MGSAQLNKDNINVAVVTGAHPFDLPAFHVLWRSLPGVDAYVQHMEDFASDAGGVQTAYDVAVFYNFHHPTPTGEGAWYEQRTKAALESLGETEQGIIVLHHAILAYPDWPLWSELVGVEDRRNFGYFGEQTIRVDVANTKHPITRGLAAWEMVDETYTMHDSGPGNEVLLTVEHPMSMKNIAWTRQYKKSRVFCFQSGHDSTTFDHPMFREVMARAVRWCAGQI